jgi:tetratricopeptide (TPR) repeat protein
MRFQKLALLSGVLLTIVMSSGCTHIIGSLKARDQLNKGVLAFRNAQYQEAIENFKNAVSLDPGLLNARLYLATAYAQEYIPGADTPDNNATGQQAIGAFKAVLRMDPKNPTALASLAQLYYNMKHFERAKKYQRERLDDQPNDPQPYYWIGVIDWLQCNVKDMELRKSLKLNVPDSAGNFPPLPPKARQQLVDENGKLVKEGLQALNKSLELKPNDFDTMAYLNLMYRQKADLEPTNAERLADLKTADNWQQKAINVRKAAAEQSAATSSSE